MSGKLFLIVGPSGSGKSSVMMGLKEQHPEFTYPLSATTRDMRPGEKDGEIYHFMSKVDFEIGIKEGKFLEYAVVHQDNFYGLIKQPVLDALAAGETVVREVDIQGFDSIRDALEEDQLISIFITVPHKDELVDRIKGRAEISDEELDKRMKSMYAEFARARDCDYMVENANGKLQDTIDRVVEIIQEESK